MQLSTEQRLHFQTYGYVVLNSWIPYPALKILEKETSSALTRSDGNGPMLQRNECASLAMGNDTPLLSAALENPLFLETAKALYGPKLLGIATYVTSHVGDTGWHADSPAAEPRGIKFSIYLDDVERNSGALRVIPGSHRNPLHDTVRNHLRNKRETEDNEVPVMVCPSKPGDVIAFDLRLFHAALGGGSDRRVINLFYYENPVEPRAVQQTREQIIEDYEWLYNKNPLATGVFHPDWLENPDKSSVRESWIGRYRELGFFKGLAAGRDVSDELVSAFQNVLDPGWTYIRTSSKHNMVRIVLSVDQREVTVMVRPKDDPHPRFKTIGSLAWGYSMLDCGELTDQRALEFETFVDRSHAAAWEQIAAAMQPCVDV
jgi:hypothetical protein